VAVSASTSSSNWSFGSGGAQVANQVEDIVPIVTKPVERLNPVGPQGVNIWSSDPVAEVSNESVGSDPWSTSGPVGSPTTQGVANSDGWSTSGP
jgi:hypothetical protein